MFKGLANHLLGFMGDLADGQDVSNRVAMAVGQAIPPLIDFVASKIPVLDQLPKLVAKDLFRWT